MCAVCIFRVKVFGFRMEGLSPQIESGVKGREGRGGGGGSAGRGSKGLEGRVQSPGLRVEVFVSASNLQI